MLRPEFRHGLAGMGPKALREEGGALIEAAVTLPLLFLLLTGAVEFAMATYASIEVSNAANAGVEYGTRSAIAAADTAGIQLAATSDAANVVLATPTVTRTYICSDRTGVSGTPPALTCSSGAAVETILTVSTQTDYIPPVHWPGLPSTFTLRGQAIRKVLQ